MRKDGTVMLDNGGDSVVLVSTIPSPFIVADDLVQSPSATPVAATDTLPRCLGPGLTTVPRPPVPGDVQPAVSPDRRSSDDCSEITSTVADEPAAAAPVASPSAASATPPPPPDYVKQPVAVEMVDVVTTISSSQSGGSPGSPVTVTTQMTRPMTTTTTTVSLQAGRQKKSLEMVVDRLKRPTTSTTSSTAPASSVHQSPSRMVTSSGHVTPNSSTVDDSVGLSLLQRIMATPTPSYRQLPASTWSNFRFRSVTGNSLLPARAAESGPPIKQLKHMCKNVRSFVPTGQRRAVTPAPWRNPAFDMLFGPPPAPVPRHRAAMHFPPRAGAYRGACVRSQNFASRPRFPATAAHLATSGSRDSGQHGDGDLSLLSLILEAAGSNRHTSTSSAASTADMWKAAIN